MGSEVLKTADVRRIYGIGRIEAERLMRQAGAFDLGNAKACFADKLEQVLRQRAEAAREVSS